VLGVSGEVLNRPVHWAVEDTTVLRVAGDGTVTGVGMGTTQVAASSGGKSGLAQITVVPTAVASVHVAPTHVTLRLGQKGQMSAETRDVSGNVLTGRPIVWTTNNANVATVSTSGLVTARAPGGAIITATSEGKSAPASVTVSLIPVATVLVSPASQSLPVGQTTQLQAEPLDSAGQPLAGRTVVWSSNDHAVATVSGTGTVTALSPGSASVSATIEGQSASADITVLGLKTVSVTPSTLTLPPLGTATLTAVVRAADGSIQPNSNVKWTSNDTNVALVASDGTVRAMAPGVATITATSGSASGSATVTVKLGG
ncbi:MAG TPA: Ig-like domain-containing protein, partial [Gemmatimonadaceae bacterium]